MGSSGSLAKQQILQNNSNNALLKSIFKFIYDPYNRCCIGEIKLKNAMQSITSDTAITTDEIIRYLTTNNTGSNEAVMQAAKYVMHIDNTYQYPGATFLAMALVTQSLTIGITAKTLNLIWGNDFIPMVGCMLGTQHDKVSVIKWPCIVTEKLDGIRRIMIKNKGVIRMYSRSGHEDTGLVDIIAEAKYLPDGYVYDGELLAIGSYVDNIAARQAASSIANTKGTKIGLSFNVFDMLPVSEFYAGASKMHALDRKIILAATLDDEEGCSKLTDGWAQICTAYSIYHKLNFIRPVPILGFVKSMDEVTPIVEKIWRSKGEGVMLNTASGLYEVKRSKSLIKIKYSEEVVLPVSGFIEGEGKYEGTLGAVVVDYKNYKVGVGSGFTDYERDDIWINKDKYIGKQIEIETFGESVNTAGGLSLNCPIFKRFVGGE